MFLYIISQFFSIILYLMRIFQRLYMLNDYSSCGAKNHQSTRGIYKRYKISHMKVHYIGDFHIIKRSVKTRVRREAFCN